jgi:2-(3-amino-3-carboxypropyl)histidine synthase
MERSLAELEERYDLKSEFGRIEDEIADQRPKSILLHFPDGLKPYATEIAKEIKRISKAKLNKEVLVKIWLGSCFGACDVPNTDSDLLIQFGHAPWKNAS